MVHVCSGGPIRIRELGPAPRLTRLILHLAAPAHRVLVPVGAPDSVPVAPLPGQLSAVARECSGGWPKCLGPAPHGRPGEAPGSCHRISAVRRPQRAGRDGHWRVNQWQRKTFLSVSLSHCPLCLSKKKIFFFLNIQSRYSNGRGGSSYDYLKIVEDSTPQSITFFSLFNGLHIYWRGSITETGKERRRRRMRERERERERERDASIVGHLVKLDQSWTRWQALKPMLLWDASVAGRDLRPRNRFLGP